VFGSADIPTADSAYHSSVLKSRPRPASFGAAGTRGDYETSICSDGVRQSIARPPFSFVPFWGEERVSPPRLFARCSRWIFLGSKEIATGVASGITGGYLPVEQR